MIIAPHGAAEQEEHVVNVSLSPEEAPASSQLEHLDEDPGDENQWTFKIHSLVG